MVKEQASSLIPKGKKLWSNDKEGQLVYVLYDTACVDIPTDIKDIHTIALPFEESEEKIENGFHRWKIDKDNAEKCSFRDKTMIIHEMRYPNNSQITLGTKEIFADSTKAVTDVIKRKFHSDIKYGKWWRLEIPNGISVEEKLADITEKISMMEYCDMAFHHWEYPDSDDMLCTMYQLVYRKAIDCSIRGVMRCMDRTNPILPIIIESSVKYIWWDNVVVTYPDKIAEGGDNLY